MKNFTQIDNDILRSADMKMADKLLYIVLLSYRNVKTNECFPSYQTLMANLGISDKHTISNSLKNLIDSGHITLSKKRVKGKFKTNVYSFTKCGKPHTAEHSDKPAECEKPPFNQVRNPHHNYIKNINYINNTNNCKLQNADFEVFESLVLVTDINKEKYYSIIGKYKKVFGSGKLIEILNFCMSKGNKFDNTERLAAYLETIKNNNYTEGSGLGSLAVVLKKIENNKKTKFSIWDSCLEENRE